MRSITRTAALGLIAALVAACNGGAEPAGDATTEPIGNPTLEATEPEPTPTATASPTEAAADDWSVPDEIDAAYVQRVIDRLDQTYLEAFVALRRADGDVGPETYGRLQSIFDDEAVDGIVTSFVELHDAGYPGMKAAGDERPRDLTVTDVLSAGPQCIHARVLVDNNPLRSEPIDVLTDYVALRPVDAVDTNPTGWEYGYQRTVGVSGTEDELAAETPCDEE